MLLAAIRSIHKNIVTLQEPIFHSTLTYVIGFATAHRTTQGKAVLAVLLPVVLCCAFAAALLFMGVLAGVAASR